MPSHAAKIVKHIHRLVKHIHRFFIPEYSYKIKIKKRFKTFNVKAHIQRRSITDKNLKKNYRYDKKLRAFKKRKKLLYCLYFYVLKSESEVLFTNAKYQITKSERYAVNKAISNTDISFFLTDNNVLRYDILYLKKYYSIKPYVKIWNATRYNRYSVDEGEDEYSEFIEYLKRKYGMKPVKLAHQYDYALKEMFKQAMSSRAGLR